MSAGSPKGAGTCCCRSPEGADHHFIVDGEPLKRVEAFKYLRTLLSMDDIDRRAINTNLEKA